MHSSFMHDHRCTAGAAFIIMAKTAKHFTAELGPVFFTKAKF